MEILSSKKGELVSRQLAMAMDITEAGEEEDGMVVAEVIMEEDGRGEGINLVVAGEGEDSTTAGMEVVVEEEDLITVTIRTEVTIHKTMERVTFILPCWKTLGQSWRHTTMMMVAEVMATVIGRFLPREVPCQSQ